MGDFGAMSPGLGSATACIDQVATRATGKPDRAAFRCETPTAELLADLIMRNRNENLWQDSDCTRIHLVLSCLVLSCLVLSCLVLSCPSVYQSVVESACA